MPASLQEGSHVGMVVDLSIENDPDPPVLVAHRLLPVGDVDDRQPSMGQAHRAVDPEALAIGSAMAQGVAHTLEARLVDHLVRSQSHNPSNAAHDPFSAPSSEALPSPR